MFKHILHILSRAKKQQQQTRYAVVCKQIQSLPAMTDPQIDCCKSTDPHRTDMKDTKYHLKTATRTRTICFMAGTYQSMCTQMHSVM